MRSTAPVGPARAANTKARKKKSPHVPGQLFGYSLQTTRATVRLLQAPPGAFVSVEVFEDVGIETADDKTAEQTKVAGTQNPIADRSVDLWKTLSNWARAIDAGDIDATTTQLELHVSKKVHGRIAESFAAAKDPGAAKAALEVAKATLWGSPPKYSKRANVSKTLAPFVDHFFASNHAGRVVERLALSFGRGDTIGDLERLVAGKLVSSDLVKVVAHQMLGWTKATIDRLLEQGKPAVVAVDAFSRELFAFVQKYDRTRILYSFATEPLPEAVAAELPARTYIRQLDLIELEYDEKLRAANDYLRAALDRSIWAEKGIIHKSSFEEFGKQLQRTWSAKRIAVGVQATGRLPVDAGKLLYAECMQVKEALQTSPVPDYFTPGCFHALAEDQVVGWHPTYKDQLSKIAKAKEK